MFTIYRKELNLFFTTAMGYVVIAIFLVGTSLFLWVFPGEWNVLDSGYASLESLFRLAPWLYLFLCPAVTMRLIAEERQTGTLELLLTKPVSRWSIVFGKLLASWTVVVVALLPTLFWWLSVNLLSEPRWNTDSAAFWGSWIGLLFLALVYLSVGIFGSSLSKNQIVVFITSAIACFLLYYGFELVGSLFSGQFAYAVSRFGVHSHYESIARGVIDSRDLVYFLLVSFIFSAFAVRRLKH
ncbi:MAG: gliding motility-associated ABC transporter permease subunit GldF [bacterium]|nr:gliding motility-associated ABC transporter permease subunit GldF [Candidatus Minthenecus merdequi]